LQIPLEDVEENAYRNLSVPAIGIVTTSQGQRYSVFTEYHLQQMWATQMIFTRDEGVMRARYQELEAAGEIFYGQGE